MLTLLAYGGFGDSRKIDSGYSPVSSVGEGRYTIRRRYSSDLGSGDELPNQGFDEMLISISYLLLLILVLTGSNGIIAMTY